MICVGLTGGIGSGKSYISQVFKALGVQVYDADSRARYISDSNPEIKSSIVSLLGQNAYLNGLMNRNFVAGMVFDNPELLEKLNEIIHPAVEADFLSWCKSHQDQAYLIKEAAILFETGGYKKLASTILVVAPKEIRIDRVKKRDSIDRESVVKRIENQWSDHQKEALADFIIQNDGKKLVLPQIIKIHNTLKKQ